MNQTHDNNQPTIRDNDLQRPSTNPGEQNVDRLLTIYAPEAIDPAFEQDVLDRMQTLAASGQTHRLKLGPAQWLIAAAMLALVAMIVVAAWNTLNNDASPSADLAKRNQPAIANISHGIANKPFTRITAQPSVQLQPAGRVTIGQTIETGAREKRRVTTPDGSVLYINAHTKLKLQAERHVVLARGQIFVEVTPYQTSARNAATFHVDTPSRHVTALGTKFAVDVTQSAAEILVTQGKVKVSDVAQPVQSGQVLRAGSTQPEPATRASHALDWTAQLMAASESPLVPASDYAGGALVVEDAAGNEGRLTLRQIHVDVHIEDGFARTTVDQVYFNHEHRQMEGTFYFPLPTNASISRLAMYVGRQLNEAGMIERKRGREVFEDIVYQRRDPALLEWMDGSTFRMRVFPIEARENKRIIISYTQKLDDAYGRTSYRFPAGHSLGKVGIWSFHACVKNGANVKYDSPTHELSVSATNHDLHLRATATDVRTDKDVVLHLGRPLKHDANKLNAAEQNNRVSPRTQFRSFVQGEHRYVMVRHRPKLESANLPAPRHWVFLFESSADRNPLLARAQVDIVRHMLRNMDHRDTFDVFTAGARVRPFAQKTIKPSQANADKVIAWLEQTHLIGALDLHQAWQHAVKLTTLTKTNDPQKQPVIVQLGTAIPALGDRNEQSLLGQLPDGVQYVGIGVGKRWSAAIMRQAAARSGGYATQINPDEPIAWRARVISGCWPVITRRSSTAPSR